MLTFEYPQMLALIIPIVIAALYLIRKGAGRKLILSRVLVLSLLVVALAAPYTITSDVTSDDNPQIVVISDETSSMNLFKEGTADSLYEALTAKTPTTMIRLTDDQSALGDAIMQYSRGDNQIVLVSDGNNNYGEELDQALDFAKETGTTVYSVQPELEKNDVSVQILGDKTVIIGNENQFDVVVSQAEDEQISYSIEVKAEDTVIRSGTFTQDTRKRTIRVPHTFESLGAQTLSVTLTPSGPDWDQINNQFYKAIYVVPKPKIRFIGDDTDSPLAEVLLNLYDVSITDDLTDIDEKKTLVLDNRNINSLSESEVGMLKDYVIDGNGLVVVGGERAYDKGEYLNSSFEELLPVISKSTVWSGGRNVVLVLDVSQSTFYHETLSDILGNAIFIIDNENLRDAYAGVIAFGSEGYDVSGGLVYLGVPANINRLEDDISQLTPGATSETSLDQGFTIAQQWLENEAGKMDVIIISDGGIAEAYDTSLEIATDLHESGINFYFIHIRSSAPSQNDGGVVLAEKLMQDVEGTHFHIDMGERANLEFEELEEIPDEETAPVTIFPLIEYNPNHFITRNLEISGNITGYNDVTPKPGADRVILTSTGKPVLTTWRYGLGRVVALTTDNGEGGDVRWSSQMYSGNNSKLISSAMNWAIGDPQVEEGAVLEAEDTWYGTPVDLTLTMYEEGTPKLRYDNDEELQLAVVGQNTYETTINDPGRIGMHEVSGYPLAVNYAIEYRDVGINEDLPVLIKANGGKTYTEKDARALLLEDARANSIRSVQRPESQKIYFILAALVLFLSEIMLRRIREIRDARLEG
ncbi:MAG: hypothetical protein K8R64_01330 [Methanosarcinaceae archaeon]|nr:hypothetical protein [Methanosarcinaceae archaeon]